MGAHADAVATVTMMQKQGQGSSACNDLAKATIAEVTENIKSQQTALSKIDTGKDCPKSGQDATKAANVLLKKAETTLDHTKKALAGAKSASVNFGDFKFSDLNKNNCAAFFGKSQFKKAAKKAQDKAVGVVSEAKKGVAAAKKAAERAVKKCQCKVYKNHSTALNAANKKAKAANEKAWTKAAHIKCVLAGTSASDCKVPTMPKLKAVKLAEGVDKSKCSWFLGHAMQPDWKTGKGDFPRCSGATITGSADDYSVKKTKAEQNWNQGCFGYSLVHQNDLPVTLSSTYTVPSGDYGGSQNVNLAYAMWGFTNLQDDKEKPHYDCTMDFALGCQGDKRVTAYGTGCQNTFDPGSTSTSLCMCKSGNKMSLKIEEDRTVKMYVNDNHCGTFARKADDSLFPLNVDVSLYGPNAQIDNIVVTK